MPLSAFWAAAAIFDLKIYVDGEELTQFGDVQIKRNCNAPGLSGVCVSELSFTTPSPFYASRAAEVTIEGLDGLPKFYVSKRTPRGGVVTVSCLDKPAFGDIMFPAEKLVGAADSYSLTTVMELICLEMFGGRPSYGGLPSWLDEIPAEMLKETACIDVLQFISEACCGIWYCSSGNNLQFLKFGDNSGRFNISEHAAVDSGAQYSMSNIICKTGKGKIFYRGQTDHVYDTIRINSDLITDEGCEEIWERAGNYTLCTWNCSGCRLEGNNIPYVGAMMSFAEGGDLVAHSISCRVTAAGIFAALSGSDSLSDEIAVRGALTRAVANCVKYGRSGHIIHTSYQGDMIVDDDEDEEEEEDDE